MKFTNQPRKIACVFVWKTGWDADEHIKDYLDNILKGIKSNIVVTSPDYFLLTDGNIDDLNPELVKIELKYNLPGWHSKFEIFREDLFKEYDQVFYFDLDCIITGNLDGIFSADTQFAMLRDFFFPKTLNSSLMAFKPGEFSYLLEEVLELQPNKSIGDQGLIEKWVKKYIQIDVWQDYFTLPSYKADFIKNRSILPGQIMFFHGHPRPHEIEFKLEVSRERIRPVRSQVVNQLNLLRAKNGPIKITKEWENKTVYIIGGGPSIKGINFDDYLMGEKVIAVNNSFIFKCTSKLFFGDSTWWNKYSEEVKEEASKRELKIYSTSPIRDEQVNPIRCVSRGLPVRDSYIGWNGNSGMASISFALQLGAKEIVLFGFDMQKSPTGENNWHPSETVVKDSIYSVWLNNCEKIKADWLAFWPNVKIINTNLNSKLNIFEKQDLNNFLATMK